MKAKMHLAIDVSWTQVETTWREPGGASAAITPTSACSRISPASLSAD